VTTQVQPSTWSSAPCMYASCQEN